MADMEPIIVTGDRDKHLSVRCDQRLDRLVRLAAQTKQRRLSDYMREALRKQAEKDVRS
jgi:uncharacterized protein (DUF1778 family)